jgi:hypothetical protein
MHFMAVWLVLLSLATQPTEATAIVTPGALLQWDTVTQDVNGGAELVTKYRVTLTELDRTPGDSQLGIVPVAVPAKVGTVQTYNPAGLFSGLPPGRYRAWVQAIDTAGNQSAWSEPLELVWDGVKPKAPVGLRVIVIIRVDQ